MRCDHAARLTERGQQGPVGLVCRGGLRGISRPTLIQLLESGEINFERPGASRHRRVRLHDVLDYQQHKRSQRRTELDELTREAAEAGLYETDADYTEALKHARKRQH